MILDAFSRTRKFKQTGIFHDDYWANDRYRFTGMLGYGKLNLKYYGVGDNPILSKQSHRLRIEEPCSKLQGIFDRKDF